MGRTAQADIVRGADVPLSLAAATGPRDALTDPEPQDYVPDIDTKGFHTGLVRQPAELVAERGRASSVHFETLAGSGPSLFEHGSLAALKEAHNSDGDLTGSGDGRTENRGVDLGGGRDTFADQIGVAAVRQRAAAGRAKASEAGAAADRQRAAAGRAKASEAGAAADE